MSHDERQILEEIRNQNSMILARLARLEDLGGVVSDDSGGINQVNISEMMRQEDPVEYLRDRNAKIKASGRLRQRK